MTPTKLICMIAGLFIGAAMFAAIVVKDVEYFGAMLGMSIIFTGLAILVERAERK